MMQKFFLAALLDNKPGVLTHISGLISRRAFNIESISAGYTEEPDVTRINIVVSVEDERELAQVTTQLAKLIDVIKIVNLSEVDSIKREGDARRHHQRRQHLPRAHRRREQGECRH